jgi:sugar lactone lactonase YvrE
MLASSVATTVGLAGCIGSEPSTDETIVETVVSISGERVPENMAFDADGNLYFGITAGEVRRLSADRTGETDLSIDDTEQVATLPGAVGVEVSPDGAIYVAVASQDESAGVWMVPPDGAASQLASISGFPNDILFDSNRDRMLVTESSGGVVYSIGTDGSRETWLDDGRLATESFGANGITRGSDGTVYIAVTRAGEMGRLIEVQIEPSGDPVEATTLVESEAIFGADGITAYNGDILVAANSQNRVVRVNSAAETETIADGDDGLVFPSDVLVGPDSEELFICNFANESPEDGGILRMRL